jgi:hypothetical protein
MKHSFVIEMEQRDNKTKVPQDSQGNHSFCFQSKMTRKTDTVVSYENQII